MGEWIKSLNQEPPKDGHPFLAWWSYFNQPRLMVWCSVSESWTSHEIVRKALPVPIATQEQFARYHPYWQLIIAPPPQPIVGANVGTSDDAKT